MKKIPAILLSALMGIMLLVSACKKDGMKDGIFGDEDHVLILAEGFNASVITPLEKPVDYPYYTKGKIEYSKNGMVVALVDYGNGERDIWATKTINGVTETFDLSCSKKSADYKKVITKPLIKSAGCPYIVEGTVEYYKGSAWIATVDYGDGSCDEWAFKTWNGGSKTFSLKK